MFDRLQDPKHVRPLRAALFCPLIFWLFSLWGKKISYPSPTALPKARIDLAWVFFITSVFIVPKPIQKYLLVFWYNIRTQNSKLLDMTQECMTCRFWSNKIIGRSPLLSALGSPIKIFRFQRLLLHISQSLQYRSPPSRPPSRSLYISTAILDVSDVAL